MLPSSPAPGTVFEGRFSIEAEAGRGGMGIVYRARDEETGERVALKLLLEGSAERFVREASVLASLTHDNVVRYVAHGVAVHGVPWLAMEWLEGEDLADRIARGPLSVGEVLAVFRAIVSALAVAHERGVVHRDIKPSNIFLVDGALERAKLLDFGLARNAAKHTRFTQTGAALGTPQYMAPEQARGEATLDARADVFSLGCVLFELLVGDPPFSGPHPIAVLAKILFEDAPRPSAIRPELPTSFDRLVHAMLAKSRQDRPKDAAAVLARLDGLDTTEGTAAARRSKPELLREERVACVLVTSSVGALDATLDAVAADESFVSVETAAIACGGSAVRLANGAALALFAEGGSPHDLAARAARAALRWRDALPDTPIALATGRAIVDEALPVGDAIDRAVEMVLAGTPGIRIDDKSAHLLEARFRIDRDDATGVRVLAAPRPHETTARTVLGREAPLVGRDRELAMLEATIAAALDGHETTVTLIIAPAGTGKSRLLGATLERAAAARDDLLLFRAAGEAMRAGTPFDLARQIVANAPSEACPASEETRDLLRELTDDPVPDADASEVLRAARADPALHRQKLTRAFAAWLDEASQRAPLIVSIEDLHWGDDPSIALLDAALGAVEALPIVVLATARPEVDETFRDLFSKRARYDVRLTRLHARASERYVRDLLPEADDDTVAFIVERSAGHPFYLEELVRLVARGGDKRDIPDSILGMVQSRFDRLGAEAKIALRAASVFGEVFPPAGVAALAGSEVDVDAALAALEDEEVIQRAAATGESRSFRHALLCDAAYESIPARDRALAHAHAADFFEAHGPLDPLVLAEHRLRADQPELSARWLARAAEDALEAHEAQSAVTLASRALEHAAHDQLRGDLERIVCEARYWLGDLSGAADAGRSAVSRLAHGSLPWLRAVHVLVNVLGQLGQNASVAELGDAVADIDVPPDLRQQQLVLLARCVSQLVYAYERQTASGLLDRIRALEEASDALDARTVAYIARARSDSAYLVGDLTEAFRQSDFAIAKFDSAGMVRERMFLQMLAHTFFGFVGRPDESLRALRAIAEEAEAMGLAYLRGFARYEVGLIEGLYGLPNACAHLDRAFADVRGSVRLEFGGGTARAIAAIHAGALDDALAALDAIRNHRVAPELRVKAVALEAFILARRGRADEALALLDGMRNDAVAILDPPWGIEDLAEVEARAVRGERALAKDALSRGIAKLEAKLAGTGIVDLDYRIVPLVGPRFVELAREFGLEPR